MGEERLIDPLLPRRRIWIGQIFCDLWQRLVILYDGAFAAEVVPNEVSDELHESLPVAQDFRFERLGKDRVGNDSLSVSLEIASR
jgi:hypothetical protein